MGFNHIAAQGSSMIRAPRAERTPVSSGLTPEQALDNLRIGLEYFFGETSAADLAAQMDVERTRIHELRNAITSRLEAEFAILDALSPDPDLEQDQPEEQHDAEDVNWRMMGGAA